MADFRIRVLVDPRQGQRGIKSMKRSLGGLERQGKSVGRAFKGMMVFAGLGAGLRAITQLADRFTHLQNRLKTVTASEDELTAVTNRLFEVANKTRAPFKATAEIYTRVALASRELQTSQEQLVQFTESLNKAVILSGATAQEAEAGMLQLSQGLASGSLRGEELRSVLEQIPVVADVIANSIGTTRGELRKMGERGEISAKMVLQAFKEARVELDERFGETIPTIDQAFTILRNSITKAVGEFNKGSGAANNFADFIIKLSSYTDELTEGLYIVGDVVKATFEAFKTLLEPMTKQLDDWGVDWGDVFTAAGLAVLVLLQIIAQVFDKIIGLVTALVSIITVNFKQIPRVMGDALVTAFNHMITMTETSVNRVIKLINFLNSQLPKNLRKEPLAEVSMLRLDNKFEGEAKKTGAMIAELLKAGMEQSALEDAIVGIIESVMDSAAERKGQRSDPDIDLSKGVAGGTGVIPGETLFEKFMADLALQAKLLGMTAKAAEIYETKLKAVKEIGRELTDVEADRVTVAVQLIQSMRDQARVLDEIIGPYNEITDKQAALNELLWMGRINTEQYTEAMRKLHLEMLELATDLDTGYARGIARVHEQLLDLATLSESVVVDAFNGAEQAIVDFVTTGTANLKQFVDQVLADLTRILVRKAMMSLIGAFAGNPVPGDPGFIGPVGGGHGYQTGGSFNVGGSGGPDSQLVAFKATPGERVDVSRPGQNPAAMSQAPQQPAQVKIINSMDPGMALDAMNTAEGERLIMNVIQRNPNSVRRMMGG